jgi:probable O-glycosylation ligase (exosortase A-associated)
VGFRDVIILSYFVGSSPVCFFRPFYGVLLWSIVAFLNPHKFGWQAQNFPLAVAIAVFTLAGTLVFSRDYRNLRSREVLMIGLLQVWFTITSVAAGNNTLFVHHIGETWIRWEFVSKVLLMTVVSIVVVNTFARLRIFVIVIAASFGLLVLRAVPFMVITGLQHRLYGPEGSMIGDNNDFGLALNMTLPLLFFLARTESEPWVRRLFGFLFLCTIPAIFCTYSRGALLGLAVLMILMILQLKERWVLLPVIAFGLTIVSLIAPPQWKERMNPTREGAVDSSARQRLDVWTYSVNLALDYPITGGGFATFTKELSPRYAPPGVFVLGPHSVYFGLLAEHGFVGLFLYLILVAFCFASAHRLKKWAKYYGDMRVVNYVTMFRYSLIGFLVSGCFLGRAYFDYFFAIVASIVVLKRVAFEEWVEEESEDSEQMQPTQWSASHAI